MNLRNKKTGEINKLLGAKMEMGIICLNIQFQHREPKAYFYNSLAELNEEWEDYKPIEPLIDDKDIRNRLRKWMEVIDISLDNHLTRVQCGSCGLIIECGDNRIAFRYYEKLLHRRKTGLVTMRELIGEEE